MMHKSYNSGESSSTTTDVVKMEINGHPYYIKSKGNVPYLYDIDTHNEVGYWSLNKGQYVMFSLYNRIINNLKEKQDTESKGCDGDDDSETTETGSSSKSQDESSSKSQDDDADYDSSSKSQEDDADELESDSDLDSESDSDVIVTRETQKNQTNTYSLIFVFFMLFVYLTLQKEFQSIYLDFVFLILINLLNTLKVFEFMNEE